MNLANRIRRHHMLGNCLNIPQADKAVASGEKDRLKDPEQIFSNKLISILLGTLRS